MSFRDHKQEIIDFAKRSARRRGAYFTPEISRLLYACVSAGLADIRKEHFDRIGAEEEERARKNIDFFINALVEHPITQDRGVVTVDLFWNVLRQFCPLWPICR